MTERRAEITGTKGPGTNKAELETKFWGVDSARADVVEKHINAGFDLAWLLSNARGGYQWIQASDPQGNSSLQSIPSGEWTPVMFGKVWSDSFDVPWKGQTSFSTVTAGSNAATLPQTTINVADLSWAAVPGNGQYRYAEINNGSTRQVVRYTGVSIGTGPSGEDQLTGVSKGSMTLATGDIVRAAPVEIITYERKTGAFLLQMAGNITFQGNGSGVRRVRHTVEGDLLGIGVPLTSSIYSNDYPGLNLADGQNCQVAGQPGFPHEQSGTSGASALVEVYQDTGSDLNLLAGGLDQTILMQAAYFLDETSDTPL